MDTTIAILLKRCNTLLQIKMKHNSYHKNQTVSWKVKSVGKSSFIFGHHMSGQSIFQFGVTQTVYKHQCFYTSFSTRYSSYRLLS